MRLQVMIQHLTRIYPQINKQNNLQNVTSNESISRTLFTDMEPV